MQEHQQLTERQSRDWKLATYFAGGAFLVVAIVLLFSHVDPGTCLFFSCLAAFAFGWQGQPLIEAWLPEGSSLPLLLQSRTKQEIRNEPEPEYYNEEEEDGPLEDDQKIALASDLHIHQDDLPGKAIFICGIRRHGKTTLGARIAEQLGKLYIPLFIPCLEGDYLSLADVLPRAAIAGHSSASRLHSNYQFIALDDSKSAYQLGYAILDAGYQVILDLSSYTSLDEAISMQINIIRGMFHWANSHPDQRVLSHVYLDEAQRYLPQQLSESVILDQVVLKELLRAYMDIIAIGGKRGISPVILTQRFAQVNKKIMAQSEVFFLLRQTHDGDLDRCMEYADSDIVTKEHIKRFKRGEGIYIGSDGTQRVTHFYERESSGKRSSTPPVAAAQRYAAMPLPKATMELAPRTLPIEDKKKVEEMLPVAPTLQERAMQAYDEGHTSIDKLAAAIGVTPWQARPIMAQVKMEKGIK